jgi:hypothetical protein
MRVRATGRRAKSRGRWEYRPRERQEKKCDYYREQARDRAKLHCTAHTICRASLPYSKPHTHHGQQQQQQPVPSVTRRRVGRRDRPVEYPVPIPNMNYVRGCGVLSSAPSLLDIVGEKGRKREGERRVPGRRCRFPASHSTAPFTPLSAPTRK